MTVIAYLTEAAVVEKILTHWGLPARPPPLAPARRPGQLELFDSDELAANRPPAPFWPRPGSRAPPRGPSHCSADDDIEPAADSFDWGA